MTGTTLAGMLAVALTITVRLSGLMLFAPFFGSAAVPPRIKACCVLACTALVYPQLSASLPPMDLSAWPAMIVRELAIGMGVGITANLAFDAVQMAGQVLSVQVGHSLVTILDPQTQAESTVLATFHQTFAMLIFLRQGVPLYLLRVVIRSFDYFPPNGSPLRGSFVLALTHIVGAIFILGIQIAAPVLSATLLLDFALGMLGKASVHLPLMLLGPAVKSVIGLGVLAAVLGYWPSLFERIFLQSVTQAEQLLALAR